MTLFIHLSLMLINYYLGEQTSYRFEKVNQNKNSETWLTVGGEYLQMIECKLSPRKLHAYQTVIVRVGILGVVRVGVKDICLSPQVPK